MNKGVYCLFCLVLVLLCSACTASLQEMPLAQSPDAVATATAVATVVPPAHEGAHVEPSPPVPTVGTGEDMPPDTFLLFAPQAQSVLPPATSGAYAGRVRAAVTGDLATRLGVDAEAITVEHIGVVEVSLALPCPTAVGEEAGAIGGGLRHGYEVILAVEATAHRYVAFGGLGRYCGVLDSWKRQKN